MQCNTHGRLGAALAVLAACILVRPAGAGVFVDVSVADKLDGKYGEQVCIKPGEKLFFRISAKNTCDRPVVAVCDLPMLKYQCKGLLLPGKLESVTLTAKCVQPGTFKPAVCVEFVDPTTGRACEVDDSCLVLCAKPGEDPLFGSSGGQQQGGTSKGGGELPTGGQQQSGGQQQGFPDPVFTILGSQQSGQQQNGQQSGQQQSGTGYGAGGQQGGPKNHSQDKKEDADSKGRGHKGKKGKD